MSSILEPAGRARFVHDLLDQARASPDHEAVRDRDDGWTYDDLTRASVTVDHRLADAGVGPGDRVLCLLAGSRYFAALLYGASRRGAVLVPASPDTTDYQLRWLLEDADPMLIITSSLNPDGSTSGVRTLLVQDLVADGPPAGVASPDPSPDAPALLIYTSGTTSRPKGIVCPQRAIVTAATSIASVLAYRGTDVVYSRLPVSFDYGLYQILLCAVAGATLVLGEGEAMPGTLTAIRGAEATVVPVVPTLVSLLCQLVQRDPRPTSVRLFTNTGAALLGADAQRLRDAFPGAQLVAMYGMSECKRITIADADEDIEHPGTVGRAIPGTRVLVLDADGSPCASGVTGQIVATGGHVMAGYWRDSAASARRFATSPDGTEPALFTGDYGHLDDAGRLYFDGRRDDLFKRRGFRMSTQEVEGAAQDVPGVELAACLPPAADGALTLWAQTALTPVEVIHGVADRIGTAKAPDRCIVVRRLPTTRNGKIDKSALLDDGSTGPAEPEKL